MLLSRTFHERNNLKEVIVPTPSFLDDHRPYYETKQQMEKHSIEMGIIYEYSPFTSEEELIQQFNRIEGESGTLVVCYNLRRLDSGAFELDFFKDEKDIRMSEYVPHREEERNSLRAYLAVLYMNPRMRVFLRGDKVYTKRLLSTLFRPRVYHYQAKNLKSCAEREYENCRKKIIELTDKLAQCKSERATFAANHPRFMVESALRIQHRMLEKAIVTVEEMLKAAEERAKKLHKAKSNPNPLLFYFGLNVQYRNRYGCMVYNNGRLIRMYEKLPNQKERNDSFMRYLGVLAIVDIPYSVLEPTHNKQSFENKREYMNVLRAINEHMEQYWVDTPIAATPGGVASFWKTFGYESAAWDSVASEKPEFIRKRFSSVGISVQCDVCLKWRHLDFQQKYLESGIPKNWRCSMHPNGAFRNCSKLEELPKIPKGRLPQLPDKPPSFLAKNRKSEPARLQPSSRTAKAHSTARKKVPSPSPPPPPRVKTASRKPTRQMQRSTRARASSSSEDDDEEESDASVPPEKTNRRSAPASRVPPPPARTPTNTTTRTPVAIAATNANQRSRVRISPSSDSEAESSSGQQQNRAKTKASLREDRDVHPPAKKARKSAPNSSANEKENGEVKSGTVRPSSERIESTVTKRPRTDSETPPGCAATDLEVPVQRKKEESKEEVIIVINDQDDEPASSRERASSRESEVADKVVRKLSTLVDYLKPHSATVGVETIEDALNFDPQSFIAAHEAEKDAKLNVVVQKMSDLVNFFKPNSVEGMEVANVDDALRFDVDSFCTIHRESLNKLIDLQVTQHNRKIVTSLVRLLKWADPQVQDEINEENVFLKMEEFLQYI